MDCLEELVALIPPPAGIKPHTESEWAEQEAKLGTTLPPDYKALIDRYGSGTFCSLLHIHSPFETSTFFAAMESWLCQIYETAVDFSSNRLDGLVLFPEPDGVLYFAPDEVGGFLLWKTGAASEEWTLIIADARLSTREEFSMTLTEFILRFAKNEIDTKKYEDELPVEPTFVASAFNA